MLVDCRFNSITMTQSMELMKAENSGKNSLKFANHFEYVACCVCI